MCYIDTIASAMLYKNFFHFENNGGLHPFCTSELYYIGTVCCIIRVLFVPSQITCTLSNIQVLYFFICKPLIALCWIAAQTKLYGYCVSWCVSDYLERASTISEKKVTLASVNHSVFTLAV